MKIRGAWPIFIVVMALLWGCDATTRYRTLRFFFDGVPSPEEKKAAREKKAGAGETPRQTAGPASWGHGPYAAKLCEGCHMRPSNALVAPIDELCFRCHEFRSEGKWVHGPLASGGCRVCHEPHSSRHPFLLAAEPESFCFHCHDEKGVMAGEGHRGASRRCTDCHDAHMSDKRYLLK